VGRPAMRDFTIIDFETTGLSAGEHRIIEVASIRVRDGEVVESFCELMDPGCYIPSFITGLTGISNGMVRGKPPPEAVMPRLCDFLGEDVCIAHNASFDQRFFAAESERAGCGHERIFLCSLLLARRLLPQAPNHKLGTLVEHLRLPRPVGRVHRALTDVLMTLELWKHLTALLCSRLQGRVPDSAFIHSLTRRPKATVESYLCSLVRTSA
jgi:DNA polymerase-3 subunit epsilon